MCVLGSKCLYFCWEMILRVQNVVWIIGWVACLIAFISVFFSSWKTIFKQSRHLSIPGLSIELFNCFLSQSWHLLIARWIDRESSCPFDSSLIPPQSIELILLWTPLDTFSITTSIKALNLDTSLDISICRDLLNFYIRVQRDSDFISLNLS